MKEFVTHNVRRFVVEKPPRFRFIPGQATDCTINLPGWKDKTNPFTFTSLNQDKVLEFTIKGYTKREGVTKKLHELEPGTRLIIRKPFGTINYHGKGVFLAGGAGITPFLAIFRQLQLDGDLAGNTLFFSNKTSSDVIVEHELREMFGNDLVLTLTEEKKVGYEYGEFDGAFLEKRISDFSRHFYICGPKAFVRSIKESLEHLGADPRKIIIEAGFLDE
ncbi:MAG TPA: FAD-binding oxidoreductase [Candidatus Thermoplasmatota archaeon]|nr:FAD-binding oxidoreductase [Candidatus Thermoplasmatota archaeon]